MKALTIKTPSTIDFLLIVRGLAAVSVIYWHLGGYLAREDELASYFIIPGRLAVWIFFMMSGYLIGYGLIYQRYQPSLQGLRRFYINRLLRIYPIFLVVSVIALIIHSSDYKIDALFILENLMMFQWDHHYPFNTVFWTLGVEVHLYIIAPILVFGFQAISGHKTHWIGLYLLILVALWGYSLLPGFVNWDMRNMMGGIAHFTIGMVLAGYRNEIICMFGARKYTLTILAIVTLTLIALFNHNYGINFQAIIMANIIGAGLITLHVIIENRQLKSNLLVTALHQLGVLSYGIYAWHGLLVVDSIIMNNFFYHFIATLVLAYTTYLLVERPLLALKV